MKCTTSLLTIFAFLLGSAVFVEADQAVKINSTFVATQEWQEIQEGQGIPAGLHVRINLTTGKKEAKLLDESERESSEEGGAALATVPENVSETPSKGTTRHNLKITKTLEEALKSLPKGDLALEYSPDKVDEVRNKYRSYKELKESYDQIRKSFQTDAEVITRLLDEYRNLTRGEQEPPLKLEMKIAAQLRIMDNFNYLVHQIDNALWFIDAGGLDTVLLPLVVNETHMGLRVQAMRILGAVTQNNPKTQIRVFERNFGSHLAQILISSSNTEELSTALYAFGSMLRKFPYAQQRLFSTSGMQALIAVLGKDCELKLKAKAVTLISDVILEKNLVVASAVDRDDPSVLAQYAQLDFVDWLQLNGYCETLDSLIANALYELLEQPDLTEYFAQALANTHTICHSLWSQSPQLRHTLLTLRNRYAHTQDEYRLEVSQQISTLVAQLYREQPPREEL